MRKSTVSDQGDQTTKEQRLRPSQTEPNDSLLSTSGLRGRGLALRTSERPLGEGIVDGLIVSPLSA
jgi:hypothetical protein